MLSVVCCLLSVELRCGPSFADKGQQKLDNGNNYDHQQIRRLGGVSAGACSSAGDISSVETLSERGALVTYRSDPQIITFGWSEYCRSMA